MKIGPPLSKL